MSILEILEYVADRGCELQFEPPDRLRLSGPQTAVTEALVSLLRSHREEILQYLGVLPENETAASGVIEMEQRQLPPKEYLVGGRVVEGPVGPGEAECWRYRGETRWLPCDDWTPFA